MTATAYESGRTLPGGRQGLRYWAPVGLFCGIFLFSAMWSLVDPEGARVQMEGLGYPGFLVYPLAVAKLLGVLAILSRRSATLTVFAFAGFLFDLLLAAAAHFHNGETYGLLAVATMGIWAAAFAAERQRVAAG